MNLTNEKLIELNESFEEMFGITLGDYIQYNIDAKNLLIDHIKLLEKEEKLSKEDTNPLWHAFNQQFIRYYPHLIKITKKE